MMDGTRRVRFQSVFPVKHLIMFVCTMCVVKYGFRDSKDCNRFVGDLWPAVQSERELLLEPINHEEEWVRG